MRVYFDKNWNIKNLILNLGPCHITVPLIVLLCGNVAFAQTTKWTGSTNRLWHVASNWDNGVPDFDKDAVIDIPTNKPRIIGGVQAFAKSLVVDNQALLALTIEEGATLVIDGSTEDGLTIKYGQVVSYGNVFISNTGRHGMYLRSYDYALDPEKGAFESYGGTTAIGVFGEIGESGIRLGGFVKVWEDGLFRIDSTVSHGIESQRGTLICNNGEIIIGLESDIGGHGYESNTSDDHIGVDSAGLLWIDNTRGDGINNANALYVWGTLIVGENQGTDGAGVSAYQKMRVYPIGTVKISKSARQPDFEASTKAVGLYLVYKSSTSGSNYIRNEGTIIIDDLFTEDAIISNANPNEDGFLNGREEGDCTGKIFVNGDYAIRTTNGHFINNGYITENHSGDCNITENNGYIRNLNGGTFTPDGPNISTTDDGNTWTGCIDSDWSKRENWFDATPSFTQNAIIIDQENDPVVATNANASKVEILAGGSLTIENGRELSVGPDSGMSSDTLVTIEGSIDIQEYGSLTMNRTTKTALVIKNAEVTNKGLIKIANAGEVGQGIAVLNSTLTNQGEIRLGNNHAISNDGIYIDSDSELINGYLSIYADINIANVEGNAIHNKGSIFNAAEPDEFGVITIDDMPENGDNAAIYLNGGNFQSLGKINLGTNGPINHGIKINGNATLLNKDEIKIEQTIGNGLWVDGSNAKFELSTIDQNEGGMLKIGENNESCTSGEKAGILLSNGGRFTSDNTTNIYINNLLASGNDAIQIMDSGSIFTNGGRLNIGLDNPIADAAILVDTSATFQNDFNLQIDQTCLSSSTGIFQINGDFINNYYVFIEENINPAAPITYFEGGTFYNGADYNCRAYLHGKGDNNITNTNGTFINNGNITEESSQNSSIDENNNQIQNLNGGDFNIGSGSSVLTYPGKLWTGCYSDKWNDNRNWFGEFPTADDDAVIGAYLMEENPRIGNHAHAASVEIFGGHSIFIEEERGLTLSGTSNKDAITIDTFASIDNEGYINIATESSSSNKAIVSYGTLTNQSTGQITIDDCARGFESYSTHALFENYGSLDFGSNTDMYRPLAIYINSKFINHTSGNIRIPNASNEALSIEGALESKNHGTIEIGKEGTIGNYGLFVADDFLNTGTIAIDNTSSDAIRLTDTLTNSGVIEIGTNDNVKSGISLFSIIAKLYNNKGAEIVIAQAEQYGIFSYAGNINNKGNIILGTENESSFDTGTAILNAGNFNNDTCGIIDVLSTDLITSTPFPDLLFSNNGLIIERAFEFSDIEVNTGYIISKNSNGFSSFNVDTENLGILTSYIEGIYWLGCVDSLWNEPQNWFNDEPTPTIGAQILGNRSACILPSSYSTIIKSVDVLNEGILKIKSDAELLFNNDTGGKLNLASGYVQNAGTIDVDDPSKAGGACGINIDFGTTLENLEGGYINIGKNSINDRLRGLNLSGTLINEGTFLIDGSTFPIWFNSGSLNNEPTGIFKIGHDDTYGASGIRMNGGSSGPAPEINNKGLLSIRNSNTESTPSGPYAAIWVLDDGTIRNTDGGILEFDKLGGYQDGSIVSSRGATVFDIVSKGNFYNGPGSKILVGQKIPYNGDGIKMGKFFVNDSCALIIVNNRSRFDRQSDNYGSIIATGGNGSHMKRNHGFMKWSGNAITTNLDNGHKEYESASEPYNWWTGCIDDEWDNPLNWMGLTPPDSDDRMKVLDHNLINNHNNLTLHPPLLRSGEQASIKALKLRTNATMKVEAGAQLDVQE